MASASPAPFHVVRPSGAAPVVLVCDHASNVVPDELGSLGVSADDLTTHIAYDIGAAMVARRLSTLLDAPLVLSGVSRLVVDCNRPPGVPSAIPETTGGVVVPGNAGLDAQAREERHQRWFRPYHDAIGALLDERRGVRRGKGPVLLSIHSFTPELLGERRPWPIALLYGKDARLAHAFRDELRRDGSFPVGDNQPYSVGELTDYTVPVHGIGRGLLHTAFEIRQDGIDTEAGAHAWADRIAAAFRAIDPVRT